MGRNVKAKSNGYATHEESCGAQFCLPRLSLRHQLSLLSVYEALGAYNPAPGLDI